jgi:hypothetical protein
MKAKALAQFALSIILLVLALAPRAQQLAPAGAPQSSAVPNWLVIVLAFVVLAIVVFLVLKHRDPAEAAKIEASGKAFVAQLQVEFDRLRTELSKNTSATSANTAAQAPSTAVPTEAAAPAGKSGTAGTFSVPVTGDPAVDIPAITAAYMAK